MERHTTSTRTDGDQHGVGYPMRTILTKDFYYIRNFRPHRWPASDPPRFRDVDDGPAKAWMQKHGAEPAIKPFYERAFGKRPARELYDLRNDPYELKNVAENPAYADQVKQLDARLSAELKVTADPRASGGGDEFDRYERRRSGR